MKKRFLSLAFVVMGAFGVAPAALVMTAPILEQPVYADNVETCTCENGKTGTRPKTAIIGKNSTTGCECGDGEGVKSILSLVTEIMTIGVGILGVLGITIVGLQYLTAGGSEEKTRKAKRRMLEIVIGLAAYAVIFAVMSWLIPGFDPFGW